MKIVNTCLQRFAPSQQFSITWRQLSNDVSQTRPEFIYSQVEIGKQFVFNKIRQLGFDLKPGPCLVVTQSVSSDFSSGFNRLEVSQRPPPMACTLA